MNSYPSLFSHGEVFIDESIPRYWNRKCVNFEGFNKVTSQLISISSSDKENELILKENFRRWAHKNKWKTCELSLNTFMQMASNFGIPSAIDFFSIERNSLVFIDDIYDIDADDDQSVIKLKYLRKLVDISGITILGFMRYSISYEIRKIVTDFLDFKYYILVDKKNNGRLVLSTYKNGMNFRKL